MTRYEELRLAVAELMERHGEDAPTHVEAFFLTLEDPDDQVLLERVVSSFSPPEEPGPLHRYHDAPSAFARDLIRWPEGKGLTPYQSVILDELVLHGRESVRGPHTLGKTAIASLAIWWFALTRDAVGEDWKAPTTAYRWGHLTQYLWPEVHKWYRLLKWEAMDRAPVIERKELLDHMIKLDTGQAFAASPADAASIEGAHADQLLYVFDEAKTIPAETWDAVEGAFAGAGEDSEQVAYALAISTPGEPTGRFYEIHKRSAGTEDWHTRHVKMDEAVASKRMSIGWVHGRERQWGRGSALFQNRVLGEFASSDEDGVIPLAWVELAQDRWRDRFVSEAAFKAPGPLERVGVDCSGSGADRTVVARRYGEVVGPLVRPRKAQDADSPDQVGLEEMATAGRIVAILSANPGSKAIVDAGGLGSGVVGRARENIEARRVEAFVAGKATTWTDSTGEWHFADVRSAAWWNLRELLDPEQGHEVCLPPSEMLVGDLCAPHYKEVSGGKIKVESKDTIRLRLKRSTDDGDAVVQAFWRGAGGPATAKSAAEDRMPKVSTARSAGDLRVRPRSR